MRKLVFANQKGGVGKTTSAIHVGAALARGGKRVLIVDADSSMNATRVLAGGRQYQYTLADVVLGDTPPSDAVIPTGENRLFLLPAAANFANFVTRAQEVNPAAPQLVMHRKLAGLKGYDFVILDPPPTLDLTVVNALAYATEVWVPVEAEIFSLDGLDRLHGIVEALRENFPQTKIAIAGIFLTSASPRTLAVPQVLQHLRKRGIAPVCKTMITRSVQIQYAMARGQTIFAFYPPSAVAEQYESLTKEILAYDRH
jgi:chromosome partitioning protein